MHPLNSAEIAALHRWDLQREAHRPGTRPPRRRPPVTRAAVGSLLIAAGVRLGGSRREPATGTPQPC